MYVYALRRSTGAESGLGGLWFLRHGQGGQRCAVFLWLIYGLSRVASVTRNAQQERARRRRCPIAKIKSGFRARPERPPWRKLSFHRPLEETVRYRGAARRRLDAADADGEGAQGSYLLRRPTEQVVQQNRPGDANIQRVHARIIRGRADLHQRVARAPHGRPQALALTANHQDRRHRWIQT